VPLKLPEKEIKILAGGEFKNRFVLCLTVNNKISLQIKLK
jgi:hypothetical protein